METERTFYILARINGRSQTYQYSGERITIGRSRKCSICIRDNTLSKLHMSLKVINDHIYFYDSSSNGSYIGFARVPHKTWKRYNSGDELNLSDNVVIENISYNIPLVIPSNNEDSAQTSTEIAQPAPLEAVDEIKTEVAQPANIEIDLEATASLASRFPTIKLTTPEEEEPEEEESDSGYMAPPEELEQTELLTTFSGNVNVGPLHKQEGSITTLDKELYDKKNQLATIAYEIEQSKALAYRLSLEAKEEAQQIIRQAKEQERAILIETKERRNNYLIQKSQEVDCLIAKNDQLRLQLLEDINTVETKFNERRVEYSIEISNNIKNILVEECKKINKNLLTINQIKGVLESINEIVAFSLLGDGATKNENIKRKLEHFNHSTPPKGYFWIKIIILLSALILIGVVFFYVVGTKEFI